MFTQPADGIGEGTDLKSASGSPGAPTTMTGPAAPGTSMVVLGGAEADEAMRTPRRRVAARATGEGRGRGGSGSGARRRKPSRNRARELAAAAAMVSRSFAHVEPAIVSMGWNDGPGQGPIDPVEHKHRGLKAQVG